MGNTAVKPKTPLARKSGLRPGLRPKLPEVLPPSMDVVFKSLFGDERNKDILASFLTEALGFKVTPGSITLLDPHLKRNRAKDKLGILDVQLKLRNKKIVSVEMQVGNLKNIRKRLEYYISNMTASQLKKGDEYETLVPVIMIVISKDKLLPETEKYHCEFGTLEKTEHFEFHGMRTIHTFELSKLPERGDDKLVDWLTFLKSTKKEEFMTLAQECKHLHRAIDALGNTSADEKTRARYFSRLIAVMDERSRLKDAKDEGLSKGIRKGRKEGRAEERAEVIRLIEEGRSAEEIKNFLTQRST
jgi:predicted transposase/invertase (TIGR01784 family)